MIIRIITLLNAAACGDARLAVSLAKQRNNK